MYSRVNRTAAAQPSALVIDASGAERHYWRDVWRYRELFYFLAWRDFSVRYRHTLLGPAWVVIRPVLTMVVFTIVFQKLVKLPAGVAPYPIIVFSALLPWLLFSSAVADAGNSIVNSGGMISKVYFPRLIIPISAATVSLADFLVSVAILGMLMAWYGVLPDVRMLLLPVFLLIAFSLSLGAGLWIASLNVRFRDFRFIVSFALQLGLYISPIGFSSAIVPAEWRLLYSCNPMVGIIDGFRWSLLGDESAYYLPGFLISGAAAMILTATALAHFRTAEISFADNI